MATRNLLARKGYQQIPTRSSKIAIAGSENNLVQGKPMVVCKHCNRSGHTESQCWKKHPELKTFCTSCKIGGHTDSTCWILHPGLRHQNEYQSEPRKHDKVSRTITHAELIANEVPVELARITDTEDVASYSWVAGPEPTITIPGMSMPDQAELIIGTLYTETYLKIRSASEMETA
jgi:hypothetical protein